MNKAAFLYGLVKGIDDRRTLEESRREIRNLEIENDELKRKVGITQNPNSLRIKTNQQKYLMAALRKKKIEITEKRFRENPVNEKTLKDIIRKLTTNIE